MTASDTPPATASGGAAKPQRFSTMLAQTAPFKGLPPAILDELGHAFRPLSVPAGRVVFQQGELGDELYFVVAGELEVNATVGKNQARLGVMRPGDLFGEIAVLRRAPRTATITAITNADLLVLTRSQLGDVVRRAPGLGAALQELMRQRELRTRMRALQ